MAGMHVYVDVVVASVAMLGRRGSTTLAALNPAVFKAIIIDEAHHATAPTYQRVLAHFGATHPSTAVLVWGCSATLRRHDGAALSDVFDQVTYSSSIQTMWEQGFLAPARCFAVRTKVDVSKVKLNADRDFQLESLAHVLNTPERNTLLLQSWVRLARSSSSGAPPRQATLVFCINVQHAKDLAATFCAAGYEARTVFGDTRADEREDTVEAFRLGRFPVLVNCSVFTEGTDIPCIDCVVMARPTCSSVLYQQMIGRGLRLFPGKQDCMLIDVVDNVGRASIATAPTLLGLRWIEGEGEGGGGM